MFVEAQWNVARGNCLENVNNGLEIKSDHSVQQVNQSLQEATIQPIQLTIYH